MTASRSTLVAALLLAISCAAPAQTPDSELPPAPGETEGRLPTMGERAFFIPDLPDSVHAQTRVDTPFFTLKPGIVLLGDYTFVSQDAASVRQVGTQRDQGDIRASRIMLRGTIGAAARVSYLVAGEYKGWDIDADRDWSMTDVSLTVPLGGPQTKLTFGKTKQTHTMEMVGDAANLAFQERVLNPFFVSRAVGAKLMHITDDRMSTLALGIYNDSWAGSSSSGPNDGTDVTARGTHLLWYADGGRDFMHLGASLRRAGADGGKLRYRGRPESDVLDYYVDTGSFAADHALHLGLEGMWQSGQFGAIGEYVNARVRAPDVGDPVFSGGYLGVSWVITGENRPYDQTAAYARRVRPTGPYGAFELAARVSRIDLDDGPVNGGRFTKTYLGANWWATHRWKFGAGWGRTWLDAKGERGVTDALLVRAQWVY
jgi:phosphate-selective porin OprO/OprP